METLEQLRQRIQSAEDLLSVVKTMKTLAAANIHQYERAVESLAQFNRTVEMGLQVTLRHMPQGFSEVIQDELGAGRDDGLIGEARPARGRQAKSAPDGRLGAVIFGSGQGLCGQFNERIVDFAVDRMNGMHFLRDNRSLIAVGARVTGRLESAYQLLEANFDVPTVLEGIVPAVQELLVHIDHWRMHQNIAYIVLFYNRTTGEASYQPQMVQLYPLNLTWLGRLQQETWPSRMLPVALMDWHELFTALIRQYFFVALHRAFAESLAGENASRLAAMQAAERNIDEHLDEFHSEYQQQRQHAITSELLDIIGGFEALRRT